MHVAIQAQNVGDKNGQNCKRKLINAHRWYVGFNTPILESDRQRRRKIRKI